MRVLVQRLDRYGQRPIRHEMVFLNDGPNSFKGKGGNVDLEVVKDCLRQTLIDDEEELDFVVNGDDPVVMDKQGNSVHISCEEVDFALVNIDVHLEG